MNKKKTILFTTDRREHSDFYDKFVYDEISFYYYGTKPREKVYSSMAQRDLFENKRKATNNMLCNCTECLGKPLFEYLDFPSSFIESDYSMFWNDDSRFESDSYE